MRGGGLAGVAPTGLYGWMRSNDARSLQFFALFAVAVQLLAALVLLLPLAIFDQAHSPLFGIAGYLTRYAWIVLALSVIVFAAQLAWYTRAVKNRAGFRFIDAQDEPRLCAVIEPLIQRYDMPPPFVATIDSAASNAFACGISRNHAVVVVTHGLLEACDDEELACVLAHELAHVKNGDIRMMAAANICMGNLRKLEELNVLRFRSIMAAPLLLAFPVFIPMMLVGGFVSRQAMRAAWRARFTIISSREFIADAMAVQITQNPAALAAVLLRIRGDETVDGVAQEDDAMMIAGRSQGADATHPDVEDRVEILARITGPMVFNAPGASHLANTADAHAQALFKRSRRPSLSDRIRDAIGGDLFGFTAGSRWAFAAILIVFLLIHGPELHDGKAMAAKFDPRPMNLMLGFGEVGCSMTRNPAEQNACLAKQAARWTPFEGQRGTAIGLLADYNAARRAKGASYSAAFMNGTPGKMEEWQGTSGLLTGVYVERKSNGLFVTGPGMASSGPPPHLAVLETERVGCIQPKLNTPDDHILPLGEASVSGFSMERIRNRAENLLIRHGAPDSDDWKDWLRSYVQKRAELLDEAHEIWGEPGLIEAQAIFDTPAHDAVRAAIVEYGADPTFTAGLEPLARAELKAFVEQPDNFLPCEALGAMRTPKTAR